MYILLHVSTTCSNLPPTTSQYLHVYTILSFTVQNGVSPLFMASQNGHTDIVDLLLKAGADVHQMAKVLPLYMPPTCTCGAVLFGLCVSLGHLWCVGRVG